MDRIDAIRKFVEKQPNDPFPRYGLAMELKKQGRNDEAEAEFADLEKRHPDYVPQFLMRAGLLQAMQRRDQARGVLERGIAAAQKKGDGHALGEMQEALMRLEEAEE